MTRSIRSGRLATSIAALLAFLFLVTACGGSSDDSAEGSAPEGEGYPVTVPSTYGDISLNSKPERIVVIGADTVDMLNALDEAPVAFAASGEADRAAFEAAYPWLSDVFTEQFDPALVTAEYKAAPEPILNYDPDLIIGTSYYIDDQIYEQLSQIAPTYVKITTAADRDWEDDFSDLAKLVGKSDQEQESVTRLDDEYAAARERIPGLQGKTVNIAWYADGGLRMPPAFNWVEDLGLRPAPNQPTEGQVAVNLAAENIGEFAGDIGVVSASDDERQALESNGLFAQLPSADNGTILFVTRPTVDAGLAAGPTSLSWLLTQIVPPLESSDLNTAGQ